MTHTLRASLLCLLVPGCGASAEPARQPTVTASAHTETADPLPLAEPAEPVASTEPPSSEPATPVAVPPSSGLTWTLIAEPARLSMARRADFLLSVVATNGGSVMEHPMAHAMSFEVNGSSDFGLDMAFSNGVSPMTWADLPPGGSERSSRAMGDMFTAPGRYQIVVTIDGTPYSTTVHVTR